MKKIVIIGVYFGSFPKNFDLWLKSCEYNSTIDFKIFTDQKIESKISNLEYIYMTLNKFDILIKTKIGNEFGVSHPYKCCDFKPVYGIILSNYIKKYDFWGHCDFDMIFGDIRKFITDDILEKYDKILPLGHLSLYRNTMEVNNRYKDKGSICGDYNIIFSSDKNYAFDELSGIANIYYTNKYPFYDKRIFADISTIYKRFRCALKDKNYNYQVFYWEKGHVYRAFFNKNKILNEEFVYIHFQKRKNLKVLFDVNKYDCFYICDSGFFGKKDGIPTLDDIKKYGNFHGKLYELFELFKYTVINVFRRIKIKSLKLFNINN